MISADEDPAAAEDAYTFEVQEIEPKGGEEVEKRGRSRSILSDIFG